MDAGLTDVGDPPPYACPECHGVLLQIEEGGRLRFRCHTGHAYSVESLVAAMNEAIDDALWNTIRAFGEGGLLLTRMVEHLRTQHHGNADTARLTELGDRLRRDSSILRQIATEHEPVAEAVRK